MGVFQITCPEKGTKVSTGVEILDELLTEPLANSAALMKCSACGKTHVWTPRGANRDEAESVSQPATTEESPHMQG